MRRTKEEAEATRLSIMANALELFAEQGVSATSLAEIAARAGVTRGAIYWHFKNKWDLFDATWNHYSDPVSRLVDASEDDNEVDPLGKLREMLKFLLISVEQDESIRRTVIMLMRERSVVLAPEIPERMQLLLHTLHQRRMRALQNAMHKGQLPADLDPEAGSLLIDVMLEGLIKTWLQHPDCMSLNERAGQFADSIIAVLQHGARQQ